MSPKITTEHLARMAIVYVRQSTMAQVVGNLESQRRQYDLAGAARATGFASVTVIDDDLGRSGSGTVERPGFERLVAMVCSGEIGAVYCIEASRLARNGRDWHHLRCSLRHAADQSEYRQRHGLAFPRLRQRQDRGAVGHLAFRALRPHEHGHDRRSASRLTWTRSRPSGHSRIRGRAFCFPNQTMSVKSEVRIG